MVPPTTPDHYTVGTQTVLEMTETRPAGARTGRFAPGGLWLPVRVYGEDEWAARK